MKTFTSGAYIKQGSYAAFLPTPINRDWVVDDMEVQALLSQADRQLGRLDMYSEYVPNVDLFIRMHVLKEATLSSRIEGTQTRMEDAIMDRDEVTEQQRDDWEEVQNYIAAMSHAMSRLEKLPLSSRLIREVHEILMQGVRGEHKMPGEFRRSQNWIGGASLNDATFIPPPHHEVSRLMGDLEQFAHNDEIFLPELLRTALIHYQFETIHPFLDGNGRVGRLLIPLKLVEKGILKRPVLYLSAFLEKNRMLYFDNLERVREKNDLAQWFKFFLTGIIQTSKEGIATFDGILQLQRELDAALERLGARAENARKVIRALYARPVTDAEGVVEATGLSKPSAYKLIDDLERMGILTEITGAQRGRKYRFERYLRLFTG